jgi:hypothetical protein
LDTDPVQIPNTASQNRAAKTGQPEQNSLARTARAAPRQDIGNKKKGKMDIEGGTDGDTYKWRERWKDSPRRVRQMDIGRFTRRDTLKFRALCFELKQSTGSRMKEKVVLAK